MKIEIGKTYWMSIEAGRRALTFTGKITSIENNFISFIDKFGKELCYNLKNIVSFEEIKNEKNNN